MAYYKPGYRWSESQWYDVATDEQNEFGDTIFEQFSPKGVPTGRKSVAIGGVLVGLKTAESEHRYRAQGKALELKTALAAVLLDAPGAKDAAYWLLKSLD